MPTYIDRSGVIDAPIKYDWDDEDPSDVYIGEDERLRNRIRAGSNRAIVALSAGFAEWIAWRLSKVCPEGVLFEAIEAVWAGIIDWHYLKPLRSLDWESWQGPSRGPICAAFNLLSNVIDIAERDQSPSPECLCLSQLVLHVIPKAKPFKDWRRRTIQRLSQVYPLDIDNILGPPVPREALDPDFDFKPETADKLLSNFLKKLDHSKNPFLRSPNAMVKAGFMGTPYVLH
jgi:hypothetical protein